MFFVKFELIQPNIASEVLINPESVAAIFGDSTAGQSIIRTHFGGTLQVQGTMDEVRRKLIGPQGGPQNQPRGK